MNEIERLILDTNLALDSLRDKIELTSLIQELCEVYENYAELLPFNFKSMEDYEDFNYFFEENNELFLKHLDIIRSGKAEDYDNMAALLIGFRVMLTKHANY